MTFVSYSQNYEDVMLWRALKHVDNGFYIDVGAWSPDVDSVTRSFYEKNWSGINIEPNYEFHSHYASRRKRDINKQVALGDKEGAIVINFMSNPGLSTADDQIAERHKLDGLTSDRRVVQVTTLAKICGEHLDNDQEIHFLKVDVEGLEEAVLRGNDWTRYRPWIVLVEATLPMSQVESYASWEPILLNEDYHFVYADGLNRFYVANEHSELRASFKYPPNVFDGFMLSSLQEAQTKAQKAETKAREAETKAQQAEAKAQQAETKAQQAETKAREAETKAREAEASLIVICNSWSWRITASFRMLGMSLESIKVHFRPLLNYSIINLLVRLFRWRSGPELVNDINPHLVNRQLNTVAVDLTPILPGGANGGAKIFVIELLSQLAAMMPQTNFVLLTQSSSHEELSILDRSNMRRKMVIGPEYAISPRSQLKGLALRVLPHLPSRLRRIMGRIGYKLNTLFKRGSSRFMLRDMNIDLLFCPFTAPTYFEPQIPTVCTIYDLQYKTYPEFFSVDDAAHREFAFAEACRRSTAIAAISNYSKDCAIAYGNLDPNRIRTIYLRMAQRNVPVAEYDKAVLNRLDLFPQQYLIYPANFWNHKNHEMLLTSFGMACHGKMPPNIKLVCTGAPGARQESLINAARNMNLNDRVLFPGYLSNAELAVMIANCSGVVFPSLYEGFGLPVIEAMAAGVPVACSNRTSLPEVAGDAAILFDPRVPDQIMEAMISMVENMTLRSQITQAGLQRAVEFSDVERMASEYWELFQYALSNEKIYENLLTGVYADGWAGPILNLQITPDNRARTFEIEFSAPEWLPQAQITVQVSKGGKRQGSSLVFKRGTNATFLLPIEATGGYYEVKISPTFVPARTCHGDDKREISVLLQKCSIKSLDSKEVVLFPENMFE